MNDDSTLVTGVASDTSVMFNNRQPSEDTKEQLDKEREYVNSIVPNAQQQVDEINREISANNNLVEFFNSLGDAPTNLSEDIIRVKLESRIAYINYLVVKKNAIINGMATLNKTIDDILLRQPSISSIIEPRSFAPTKSQRIRAKLAELILAFSPRSRNM